MTLPLWAMLLGIYLSFGFFICVFATGEMLAEFLNPNEFPPDPEFRWWHVPRIYAFCLFCSPVYITYIIFKIILESKQERHRKEIEDFNNQKRPV